MTKRDKYTFYILYFGMVFIYHSILGLQGLNMQDEGYCLTAYQQVFIDPESILYNLSCYLSVIFGGLWYTICGEGGVFAFRLLSAFIIAITFCVVAYLAIDIVNKWCVVVGTIMLLAYSDVGTLSFHHNELSALLISISAVFLYKGCLFFNKKYLFVAGFIIGLDIFARLANIALICLVLVPFVFHVTKTGKSRLFALKDTFAVFFGFFFGVLCVLCMMMVWGHFYLFMDSLNIIKSSGTDEESTHNIWHMLYLYCRRDYLAVIKYILLLFFLPCLVLFEWGYKDTQMPIKRVIVSCVFILYLCCLGYLLFTNRLFSPYTLYAILTLSLIVSLFLFRNVSKIYLLCIICLVIAYCQPLGSDQGFINLGANSLRMAFPIALGLLFKMLKESPAISKNKLTKIGCYSSLLCTCVCFTSMGVYKTILHHTHYENNNRFEMNTMPHTKMANVFISSENSYLLDDLMNHLNQYVKENDFLLCIEHLPMVHYLTKTRPYLYNSWPFSYNPHQLKLFFDKAYVGRERLPVVLLGKTVDFDWYNYDPDWNKMDINDTFAHKNARTRIYNDFVKNNKYIKVWENECFVIMIPPGFNI